MSKQEAQGQNSVSLQVKIPGFQSTDLKKSGRDLNYQFEMVVNLRSIFIETYHSPFYLRRHSINCSNHTFSQAPRVIIPQRIGTRERPGNANLNAKI